MKEYNPKVSIVIPAYKAANYLAEAIDSALAQTYTNIEIIVVNDGSPDDGATRQVALAYGEKIRYYEKENGGSSSALNEGIKHMSGEWFSWLSHDDLYTTDKIQKQIDYMQQLDVNEEELSNHIFFSASDVIDAEGKIIRKDNYEKSRLLAQRVEGFPHNGYLIAEPMSYTFHGCSCLVHRDVFEKLGGFDEKLRLLNDLDMWFRIYANNYKIHYLPESLVQGRVHAKQVSRSIGYSYHNPEQDMFWKRSLEWLLENHPDNEELFYLFGKNAFLKTRNVDGERAFRQVIALNPDSKEKIWSVKMFCQVYAGLRMLAKQIYMKIGM